MQTPPWLFVACLAVLTSLFAVSGSRGAYNKLIVARRRSSSDPAVAFGQTLSGEDNPDPIPETFQLTLNGEPTGIDYELRAKLLAALPLAQVSYCTGTQGGVWGGSGCGIACDLVPGQVDLLWHAGDGDLDPHRLLLYVHETNSLVLSVEGSSFKRLQSILNDIAFVPLPSAHPIANSLRRFSTAAATIISGNDLVVDIFDVVGTVIVSGVARVHGGFAATWARLYPEALSQVNAALATHNVSRIVSTGHSLGSAVAMLDTLALRNDVDAVPIENIGFGSPRVFNSIGARLVDQLLKNFRSNVTSHHVHHNGDLITHLGPLILGFSHSIDEVFLPDNSTNAMATALSCPGYENVRCSNSRALKLPVTLNQDDHKGPYLGQLLGRNDAFQCYQSADYAAAGLAVPIAAAA